MRTVYDAKTGEPVTLNAIDAREWVACGLATETQGVKTQSENSTDIKKSNADLTVKELKAKLVELGIDFSAAKNKAELLALFPNE